MSCETRMARSFGTVREDGSKDGVRYSISGSEAEAMAHLLFCVYSSGFICLLLSSQVPFSTLHPEGKEASRRESLVRKLFSDRVGEILIVKRVNVEILHHLVLRRYGELVVANGQTFCSRKSCDWSKLQTKLSKVFDK